MVDKTKESKYVHESLYVLSESLVEALQSAVVAIDVGLTKDTNAEDLLDELRKVEVASDLFKAFLKASYNDDRATWTYEVPREYSDLGLDDEA